MDSSDMSVPGKRDIALGLIAAVIIALIVLFSIKWPGGGKTLGDEYTSHIYSHDSFRLLTSDFEDDYQLMLFRHDNHHDDVFTFEYDDDTDSYLIYIEVRGERLYLSESDDNKIYMSRTSEADGCRWKVKREGNSMFFYIINTRDNMVMYEAGNLYAELMPYENSDENALMRLQ